AEGRRGGRICGPLDHRQEYGGAAEFAGTHDCDHSAWKFAVAYRATPCSEDSRRCERREARQLLGSGYTPQVTPAISQPCLRMNPNRRPGLIGGVTKFLQRAIGALRTARHAQLPPMPDHFVRKICPAIARNDPH